MRAQLRVGLYPEPLDVVLVDGRTQLLTRDVIGGVDVDGVKELLYPTVSMRTCIGGHSRSSLGVRARQ